MMNYRIVCGLEVHTELLTASKIFCSCSTRFGAEPNTQCCEICTGMPGTLPQLNAKVVEFAVRAGLALHCDITKYNKFDRKNYFYPDLPKAYQISQLYLPICRNGYIELDSGRRIRIKEIHMEEDAGKLFHENGKTLINYNRCGVPLLEIVSAPDIRTPEEAGEFARKLRDILRFCGVSDCKMQEGSLRADVNVSVMNENSDVLGTRTEMKNINSFTAIEKAVETESKRQIELLENGGAVRLETRRWDDRKNTSFAMRKKEEAPHYKYFPEPDIPPLVLDDAYIEEIRRTRPELPDEKKRRYVDDLGISAYDAAVICTDLSYVRLFEKTAALTGQPKESANWIMGEVMYHLSESGTLPEEMHFSAASLAQIITLLTEGKISRATAKAVFERVFYDDVNPTEYIEAKALFLNNNTDELERVVAEVIANHPKAVAEYQSGKEKAIGYLIGQVMKRLGGKASAPDVSRIITSKLQQ